jgi:hypothetical protein
MISRILREENVVYDKLSVVERLRRNENRREGDTPILIEADATADNYYDHWKRSMVGVRDALLAQGVDIVIEIIDTMTATGNNLKATLAPAAAVRNRPMTNCITFRETHTMNAPEWEHQLEEPASGSPARLA